MPQLQGVLYLWLSIWGLVLRECSQQITDIAKQPFQYIMDLIYFYGKSFSKATKIFTWTVLSDEACGNRALLIPMNGTPTLLNFTSSADTVENRTFIFLICYVIISTMWILTSLWSVMTHFCRAHKTLRILSFGTWFAVVLAGSILDAVATGYHVYNLVHTTVKLRVKINEFLKFIIFHFSPQRNHLSF